MKTLTEFSGTLIRMAAKAEAEARKALPPEVERVAPGPTPGEGVTAKPNENASAAGVGVPADSPSDAAGEALAEQAAGGGSDVAGSESGPHIEKPGEAGTTEDVMQPPAALIEQREESDAGQDLAGQASDVESGTPGGAKPTEVNADEAGPLRASPETETSAVKEVLDKAVAEATGTTGERLDRLREALKAAGRQTDRVRLVRVFGTEEEVANAKRIGEHQYIVDLMPASMKQNFERDDRGRRGPRRPTGGKKDAGGSLEGSFSMESVMQDRKSERGPGGARRGPGGGRAGPGGRGGPGGGRGGPGGGRSGSGRPGSGGGRGAPPKA